jgi:uncharacterized protein
MVTLEQIKAFLSGNKEELRSKYKVTEIGIFGSFIRGEQRESSDIDVLVDFEEGADLFNLVGLALYLEERFHHKVDVIPKRALREEIKRNVLSEVVSL